MYSCSSIVFSNTRSLGSLILNSIQVSHPILKISFLVLVLFSLFIQFFQTLPQFVVARRRFLLLFALLHDLVNISFFLRRFCTFRPRFLWPLILGIFIDAWSWDGSVKPCVILKITSSFELFFGNVGILA